MPVDRTTINPTQKLGTFYEKFNPPTTLYGSTGGHATSLLLGSEGHYGYPNFPPDRNVGGLFRLYFWEDVRSLVGAGELWRQSDYNGEHYVGSLVTQPASAGWSWSNSQDITGDPFGISAYNRMKPTQPNFQGLNAVYELREVPGMLRQRLSHNDLKNIGSYYLALQFGWRPLLNDIRNFVRTQMNAQKRLKQLLRDNGKPVRRRVVLQELSESTSVTMTGYNAFDPVFVTQMYRAPADIKETTTNIRRVWASARFRYWLPPGPQDVNWQRKMTAAIFGFQPSPAVVWNALPWTWLSDWFLDIGGILENMDAGVADRLAADYYYIMMENKSVGVRDVVGHYYHQGGSPHDITGTSSYTVGNKGRVPGDPFGWNTSENNLSGMQLSILGALGLSRLR